MRKVFLFMFLKTMCNNRPCIRVDMTVQVVVVEGFISHNILSTSTFIVIHVSK